MEPYVYIVPDGLENATWGLQPTPNKPEAFNSYKPYIGPTTLNGGV